MVTVIDPKLVQMNVNDPGAIFGEADSLLQRAKDMQDEQVGAIEASSLESRYSAALSVQIEAKLDQAESIEDRLEHLIEQQASRLQQTQVRQPGLISLPGSRAKWSDSIQQQQASMLRLQGRLEMVREIKDGMGLHGPRIEELAARKLRDKEPELADAWDELREAQRLHQLHQRRIAQDKKQALEKDQRLTQGGGQSLCLAQTRS